MGILVLTPQPGARIHRPLLIAASILVLFSGFFAWVWINAEDTALRRALRVPAQTTALDLSSNLAGPEFTARIKAALSPPAPVVDEEKPAAATPSASVTSPSPVSPTPVETEKKTDNQAPDVQPAPPSVASRSPVPMATPEEPARPESTLLEVTPQGPLPKISEKGERPWRFYSHPVEELKPPAVAIVVQTLGLNAAAMNTVMMRLPREVTLAFNPYAREVDRLMGKARGAGFELLMGIPMQPVHYPRQDPGPRALMTDYAPDQNIEALKWNMGRGGSYVGIIPIMGDAFTESAWRIDPILKQVHSRGLLFVDGTTPRGMAITAAAAKKYNMPYSKIDVVLDQSLNAADIEAAFAALEKSARTNGMAAGLLGPSPISLKVLHEWLAGLEEKKIMLVPVSVLAARNVVQAQ